MFVDFKSLSKDSRVWIFQSIKSIDNQTIEKIKSKMQLFLDEWKSHQINFKSSFEIRNNTILVAHDLSPIDALKYCKDGKVKGILTDLGGATSHTAIIARSLGIPTIMSLVNISTSIEPGQRIYVDGYKGRAKWKVTRDEKNELADLKNKS